MPNYSHVTQDDYENVAGPSWPSYDNFIKQINVPDFVFREVDEMLGTPVAFSHPSFCVLPFYGVEYPSNTPCCLVAPGTNRKMLQQEMLLGNRPDACGKCWELEDAGLKSDRLIKNSTLDFYYNRNIVDIYQECVDGNAEIVSYKFDTNNVCNGTCITCDSKSSSAWGKLTQQHEKNSKPKIWQILPNEVNKNINYKTAETIIFRGGEPFMSKTNFYILEQLVKHGNTDCFVSFVTNGNSVLTTSQKKLLEKFKNLNFCFSIDGVGPVFEYLRYPLKFDVLLDNIEYCKANGISTGVSYTVSNLNILYHSQTVQWFKENNLEYLVNPVYTPSHFRPSALPAEVKQKIKMQNTEDVSFILGTHTSKDDEDYSKFLDSIKKQDAWKNVTLKYYLPELANLLDLN